MMGNGFGFFFSLEEVKMLYLIQAHWCLNSVGAFVAGTGVFNSLILLLFCLFYSSRGISQIYFLIR